MGCSKNLSPEGTEAHAPDHVEEGVKYEQTQQQVEEHGLSGTNHRGRHIISQHDV